MDYGAFKRILADDRCVDLSSLHDTDSLFHDHKLYGQGVNELFGKINETFGTSFEPGSFTKFFPEDGGATRSDLMWANFFRRPVGAMVDYPRLSVREFYEILDEKAPAN